MKVSPVLLVLALAVPGAAAAQDMYRSTMPDGSVRYGESPAPGAKSVRKIAPPPPATGVTIVTPDEQQRQIRPQEGGVAVLPTQPRTSPQPAAQGQLHAPSTLPRPAY